MVVVSGSKELGDVVAKLAAALDIIVLWFDPQKVVADGTAKDDGSSLEEDLYDLLP
jgi:predicted NBD/HSP70 family sugar kinase